MNTHSFLAAAVLFAAPAAAQFQHADATLYTRIDGPVLRAAIQLKVDIGWHIYHSELGPPDAIGKPTVVTPGGEGIEWGEVRFPEPFRHEQPGFGDQPDTWIYAHDGTIVLYAAGLLADEAAAENATVDLTGLTCEDGIGGTCVPYSELGVTSAGEGKDKLFEDFPEDLVPKPDDQHSGGEADATLYTRVRDGEVLAVLEIEISSGWHLFHSDLGDPKAVAIPTTIELGGEGIEWGEVRYPEPEVIDQFDSWANAHHGTIVVYARGALEEGATGADVTAKLSGQTCSEGEGGICIEYEELAYDRGEGPDELFADFDEAFRTAEKADTAVVSAQEEDNQGLLLFLLSAVGWGLFALLMPCTYPMIPITISFFTKQADARGGNVLPLSLLYGLGIVLIFILIGTVVGVAIIPFAQHPVTNLIIAALFVLFAFVLFGAINLNPPQFLMAAAGKASMTGGYLGVFLMGACLVVTSFTCTAPFVGTLLAQGAADGDLGRVVIGMGTFGLTMAIPFVLLSLLPGKVAAMPKSGEWMNTLKVTLGFVELAAAFKFLSNADLVWKWDVFSRELFLFAWFAIFAAAAVYLFFFAGGKRATLSSGRSLGGASLVALALYCAWGGKGNDMDQVMTAIIPNYSGGRFFPELWVSGARHSIVYDDYDAAVERAIEEDKLLLVNFTGYT